MWSFIKSQNNSEQFVQYTCVVDDSLIQHPSTFFRLCRLGQRLLFQTAFPTVHVESSSRARRWPCRRAWLWSAQRARAHLCQLPTAPSAMRDCPTGRMRVHRPHRPCPASPRPTPEWRMPSSLRHRPGFKACRGSQRPSRCSLWSSARTARSECTWWECLWAIVRSWMWSCLEVSDVIWCVRLHVRY